MRLPSEQQQHEEVNRQSPPAAAWPQEVGSKGVATATVVEAPAQIRGEGHVEEQELAREDKQNKTSSVQMCRWKYKIVVYNLFDMF